MSIESQLTTLQRTFGGRPEIEIVGVYEEAFSAKAPGRSRFNELIGRIEKGEAAGIIAWAPDRLARNSVDGGQVIYLLDRGIVRDLKFATYTFENNPQGKFMLQIMFGQSKYYSDALSENVKRGNRTKIEHGWRPNQAPLGYLNDPETKTIVKDPLHFPLIRKMFDLMLTGVWTPKQIAIAARDEWGVRTPKKKRIGGKPFALSSIYKILSNPFYAGIIVWGGQSYPGKHEPIVSIDEFERVRRLLQRPGSPRPQRHAFAYTGMIRCGTCGLRITAEHKTNRYGSHYTYYHCTKRNLGPRCTEPSVELRALEQQVETFIRSAAIHPKIEAWVLKEIGRDGARLKEDLEAKTHSLESSLHSVEKQLGELTGLRLRDLLTDPEFITQRSSLQKERLRLLENIAAAGKADDRFEPVSDVISFSNRAVEWFSNGDDQTKRFILQIVGSNPILKSKILSIEARKPFVSAIKTSSHSTMLGVDNDVRTIRARRRWLHQLYEDVQEMLADEKGQKVFDDIRELRRRLEPEAFVKVAPSRSRRARAA